MFNATGLTVKQAIQLVDREIQELKEGKKDDTIRSDDFSF